MKTLKTYHQFLNEAADPSAFMSQIERDYDASDVWTDTEAGKQYVVIETEGFNKKAEDKLKAEIGKVAQKYGFKYAKDYSEAQKLGIGNAYADDALLIYVGK